MKTPIYLDYAATTPVDPRVAERMMGCLTIEGNYGNPASRSHVFGWEAEEAVENARAQVANLIGSDPREIVWTSGATEADNLAIKGVAHFNQQKGKHIITSRIEHKAVLDTCCQLEREGYEVTYLDPDEYGIVSPEKVAEAIREDTTIVSLMHVNNELGSLNDIGTIGAVCREHRVVFHVDAAQSAGKESIDVNEMNIDLMSFSGHKIYGPKGIGALYVRRKPHVRLEAQMHGGSHERGMRSGTLPTHQIVGMGEAFRLAGEEMQASAENVAALSKRLLGGLNEIEEIKLNGHPTRNYPGIVNVSFAFVEGESLLMALKDMAVSSGSACTSASLEPSYVLRALGVEDELAHSSIRFSIGRYTTTEEIDYVVEQTKTAVSRLRELSPLWDAFKEGVDLPKLSGQHTKLQSA
jgi:cysteine desulfurase